MSTDPGILIAPPGGIIGRDRPQYDSRKKKLQVWLKADPAHVNVVRMNGGSAFVVTPGNFQEETLLTVNHKLGFTPKCLVYFYVVSYGGSETSSLAGGYGDDRYFYSGSAGTIEDKIYFEVDDNNLYIKHRLDNFMLDPSWTSDAPNFFMSIKYMICSNKKQAL